MCDIAAAILSLCTKSILCPHVSHRELVFTPADCNHKLGLVLDVLVLKTFHVLQTCDFHKRQTNYQRRVPCDTFAPSPIFMHLPDASHTNAVRTEIPLNGSILPEAPLSVRRDGWKILCAGENHPTNEVFGFWLVSIGIGKLLI